MFVEKFLAKTNDKVSREIMFSFPEISYHGVMKLLRQKDIKVNNVRVSYDAEVFITAKNLRKLLTLFMKMKILL